ncbi:TetR/AcrR family transcriptional regulator [Cryptosporangium minutisporangium]|uniref:TetR/AcrR family transcriptional regulator n=1 Tax=Cryptosporangium minutisporangium TaxID=113569 RepID=A0ABP6SQM9_9ACTN
MGAKGRETRTRLVSTARTLIEAQGYFGTGLNQILAESGAPRGSLYFHFPGGKDQLVAAALSDAGDEVAALIRELEANAPTALALAQQLIDVFAERMHASGYTKGCPLATVALEVAASNDALQSVCAEAYLGWQQLLASRLIAEGSDPAKAEDLASSVLALVEGALLLGRARRSVQPLEQVRRVVETLLG